MKAAQVEALNDYKIKIVFADGVSGIVDLTGLIQKGIFQKLKDIQFFKKVYTDGSSIAWSDELEIDIDNIYAEIQHKDPSQLLHNSSYHAAD
jgi:hypothetical protein